MKVLYKFEEKYENEIVRLDTEFYRMLAKWRLSKNMGNNIGKRRKKDWNKRENRVTSNMVTLKHKNGEIKTPLLQSTIRKLNIKH